MDSEYQSQLNQNQAEIGQKCINIRKCYKCHRYDSTDNLSKDNYSHYFHTACTRVEWHNRKLTNPPKGKYPKLKKHEEAGTHCSITGIKFQEDGDYKPHWDHDHDTGKYRAVIPAVFNRLEGCFKSIMKETGASYHQIADWVEDLHNIPGENIGIKPYPVLGYATKAEAKQSLNETTN